jgi:trehalose 6-phosphate phosphatase
MISLFSPEGLASLAALEPERALIAFDFDGTLARIVTDPAKAGMTRKTAGLLRRLAAHAKVAVISGRSAADLAGRLGFEPAFLVGNHGLEGPGSEIPELEKARADCRAWLRELRSGDLGEGVEIEDKNFSLTLHYRQAPSRAGAKRTLRARLQQLKPVPRVIEGKLVFNLIPRGAPDKGSAVLGLLRRSGLAQALFIGDDDTDEDVFRLAEDPARLLTVRVGRKKSSRAAFYIPAQARIDDLLSLLLEKFEMRKL